MPKALSRTPTIFTLRLYFVFAYSLKLAAYSLYFVFACGVQRAAVFVFAFGLWLIACILYLFLACSLQREAYS
jgi:hypothetical protein